MTVYAIDVESYPNFFMVAVMENGGGARTLTLFPGEEVENRPRIKTWQRLLESGDEIVTFNGSAYDLPMMAALCAGWSVEKMNALSNDLIKRDLPPWKAMKGLRELKCNHIDLYWVTPLMAGLKQYGGRLHTRSLQDLPLDPTKPIDRSQKDLMTKYCLNDCRITIEVYRQLKSEIELREVMSKELDQDLRSCSDAQIGERVLVNLVGLKRKKRKGFKGGKIHYDVPMSIDEDDPCLAEQIKHVAETAFIVTPSGGLKAPKEFNNVVRMGAMDYKMGVGGLHSTEKSIHHSADESRLEAWDVTSYYPNIILNEQFVPKQNPTRFLHEYGKLVKRRVAAKRAGDRATMDVLRIAINGSFGKFGSVWSPLFDPQLLLQVTMTGQLQLLMMISALERHKGVEVVSANTDGLVVKFSKSRRLREAVDQEREDWEIQTGHNMEVEPITALYARDVNNYVITKADGSVKRKGAFTDQQSPKTILWKNPANEVSIEAAVEHLKTGRSVESYVMECADVRKFLTLRTVRGGALYGDEQLGSVIRWHYSIDPPHECIRRADSGAKVPRSEGARPMMQLADELPKDLDHDWYIMEANDVLRQLGAF